MRILTANIVVFFLLLEQQDCFFAAFINNAVKKLTFFCFNTKIFLFDSMKKFAFFVCLNQLGHIHNAFSLSCFSC